MADYKYTTLSGLILLQIRVCGPLGWANAMFVLDTGASQTIIIPDVTDSIGFSARDGHDFSTVQSPIGKEHGYRLKLTAFEGLGKKVENFEVSCHDLGVDRIEGLLGMNFLNQFNFCIYPTEQIIRVS